MGGSRTRLYRVRKIPSIVIERLHFIRGNATSSLLDRRSTVMLGAWVSPPVAAPPAAWRSSPPCGVPGVKAFLNTALHYGLMFRLAAIDCVKTGEKLLLSSRADTPIFRANPSKKKRGEGNVQGLCVRRFDPAARSRTSHRTDVLSGKVQRLKPNSSHPRENRAILMASGMGLLS